MPVYVSKRFLLHLAQYQTNKKERVFKLATQEHLFGKSAECNDAQVVMTFYGSLNIEKTNHLLCIGQ